MTSDLAIGLRVSLEDAEKIKVNASELMKKKSKNKEVEINKNKKKKEDNKNKDKKVIDVSELAIEDVDEIDRALFKEIIEARLSEIFELVKDQLEQSGTGTSMPAGVVITGGGAQLPGITKIAKRVFKVPARVGYPKNLDGLADEITGPAYSTIQGLITYGNTHEGERGSLDGGGMGGICWVEFLENKRVV